MRIVRDRKTWEEIDVNKILSIEDFCTLFEKAPLNEEEKRSLGEYYQMYETFIGADVNPIDAWITIRNIFAIKNQQIAERIKNEKTSA